MPVISQQNGVNTVAGLPHAWGVRAYRELKAAQGGAIGAMPQAYCDLSALLDKVVDAPVAIDATDAQICLLAERYANECGNESVFIHDKKALRARLAWICNARGIVAPDFEHDQQVISRCTDAAWWRRQLRKTHGRAFEHAAIQLGRVSKRTGKYCSDESVKRRIAQNRRNASALQSVTMTNEDGKAYTLAELAAKGNGNKRIRRGELMMRMAGCEDVAIELGHVGIFVTGTVPGKFHAVLEKSGERNPKYNGASPLDAQKHLNGCWAKARAQNGRDGITPYGFRIAEPHHDGCTHWHMLMFMPAEQTEIFKQNLTDYWCEEDTAELYGDTSKRIKFEQIDPAKGGAAGYMAKYVGKNIAENTPLEDLFGNEVITLEMRVDAWAGTWGIRQFQPVGQPPVTTWRELRRVPAKAITGAPEHIQAAHAACQRVYADKPDEEGEFELIHAANWGEYINAQGGVNRGKDCLIGLSAPVVEIEGRYGLIKAAKPVGIYCKAEPEKVYASTRYTWKKSTGATRFCSPWSPVNNCTQDIAPKWEQDAKPGEEIADYDPAEWFGSFDAANMIFYQNEVDELKAQAGVLAGMHRDCTVWTRLTSDKLREENA